MSASDDGNAASGRDRYNMRVAINQGFRNQLSELAWKAGFLHYLTVEQQCRVQQMLDELKTLFDHDQDQFSDWLGKEMVESIRRRPPVQ